MNHIGLDTCLHLKVRASHATRVRSAGTGSPPTSTFQISSPCMRRRIEEFWMGLVLVMPVSALHATRMRIHVSALEAFLVHRFFLSIVVHDHVKHLAHADPIH